MQIQLKWIKRKTICSVCGEELPKGSKAVSVWFKYGDNYYPKTVCKSCYTEHVESWWKKHPFEPIRRGASNQRKSSFPTNRRKLLSLLIYHRKRGNITRIQELEAEITRLESI